MAASRPRLSGWRIAGGVLSLAGAGIVALRISFGREMERLPKSESHDASSALLHLVIAKYFRYNGGTLIKMLDLDSRHLERVQESLLVSIMRSHDLAEFPRSKLKVHIATDPDSYRDTVPITTYEDYRDYVRRTEQGQGGLLLSRRAPPTQISLTAGTDGPRPKRLLLSKTQQDFHSMYTGSLIYKMLFEWRPASFSLQRTCRILLPSAYEHDLHGAAPPPSTSDAARSASTPAGSGRGPLPVGVDTLISTEGNEARAVMYSTPQEALLGVRSSDALLYLHLLYALRERGLSSIHAEFAPLALRALELLEDDRTRARLLDDIRTGSIAPHLDEDALPVTVRLRLEEGNKPDRGRAREVQEALRRHDARGRVSSWFLESRGVSGEGARAGSGSGSLVGDVWPGMQAVITGGAGPLQPTREALRRRFLPPSSEVPILDPLYQCAEAVLGVNVTPSDRGAEAPEELREIFPVSPRADEPVFALLPQSAFFEFIPVEEGVRGGGGAAATDAAPSTPSTRLMHEVEVGRLYEPVITTKSGLWRYRTGDVVRVEAVAGAGLPFVSLVTRASETLPLPVPGDGDAPAAARPALDSSQVWAALQDAEAELSAPARSGALLRVDDYAFSLGGEDQRLTVAVEACGARLDPAAGADAVERALRARSASYDAARASGSLRPLRVLPVPPGTTARSQRARVDSGRSPPALARPIHALADVDRELAPWADERR